MGNLGAYLILVFITHLSAPDGATYVTAYKTVCDPTIRFVFATITGTVIGEFINAYLLSKWKVKLKGKAFILRCLGSTAAGQISLSIIVDILAFAGGLNIAHLIWLMFCGYIWKMAYAVILAFPCWLIVKKLKTVEQVDYFDIETNFNPFRFSLETKGNLYSG